MDETLSHLVEDSAIMILIMECLRVCGSVQEATKDKGSMQNETGKTVRPCEWGFGWVHHQVCLGHMSGKETG